MEKIKLIVDLTLARIEILKMKANIHDWSCYVPEEVKEQLEKTLIEIDQKIKELNQ